MRKMSELLTSTLTSMIFHTIPYGSTLSTPMGKSKPGLELEIMSHFLQIWHLFVLPFRYFTWDGHKFPHSIEMIGNLTAKGRKMVTIIDPHIKRESGYFVHENALGEDLYVKDRHGKVYEGNSLDAWNVKEHKGTATVF